MPGLSRFRSLLSSLLRPVARLEDHIKAFWSQTPAHRRFSRVLGIVLFGVLSLACMGFDSLSCGGCSLLILSGTPLAGIPDPSRHSVLAVHPRITGSDGSQTGVASFLGNATTITQPSQNYFILQRRDNCTINLLTAAATTPGNATLTANTSNYERTLHQLAGLKTTADVYPGGCAEKNTGISSTYAVWVGYTTQNNAVAAATLYNGSTQSLYTAVLNSTLLGGNFSPQFSLPYASSLATSDLNKDGNGDLVVVNGVGSSSPSIAILLGNADGSFQSPVSYALAGTSYAVTATIDDLNGDGKLDIVAVTADQQISILLGKGDGTFNAAQSFAAPTLPGFTANTAAPFVNVITADVNGDGKQDIVGSNGAVLLGKGDGTFTAAAIAAFPYTTGSTFGAPFLTSGDFNNDGKQDLAVSTGYSVTLWIGKGDGTFTRGAVYAGINNLGGLTVSDLDGDGNLDLYLGLGNGGLYSGDGASPSSAYFLMGNGDGTFVGAPTTPTGSYTGTNLADVNGDGIPDLVTAATSAISVPSASFTVQLGNGKGAFTVSSTIPSPANFTLNGYNFSASNLTSATLSGYALADIDGDNKADLVFVCTGLTSTNPGSGLLITYAYPVYFTAHSNGDGTFAAPLPHAFPQIAAASGFDNTLSASSLQIADFNKDGKADLLFTYNDLAGGTGITPYQQGFVILTGNGDATFSTTPILTSTYSSSTAPTSANLPKVLSTADVNNDGKPDLVVNNTTFTVGTGTVSQLQVYVGNGDGTFKTPTTLLSSNQYGFPAVADFNKDGKIDLAFLSETTSSQAQLNLAVGNGDGTFTVFSTANLTGGDAIRSSSLAAADFDADGNLDLALFDANSVSGILYGKGTGSFNSVPNGTTVYPKDLINLYASGPAIAVDLNKDGKPDLLVGSTILLNTYGTTQVVTQTGTSTAVTASPNPATVGATVTLTATITPASGTGTPTGTVTFLDGTTTLGTGTLTSGKASITTATLTAGSHSITAVYAGDTNFTGSTSTAVSLSITAPVAIATSMTLSASANPVVAGTNVTFTATTAAASGTAIPTGLVTFLDGTTALGIISLDTTGKATFTTSTLAVGSHSITAAYAGSSSFTASTSSALAFTVTAPPTPDFGIALSPTSATVTHGNTTTATITLTPIAGFKQATTLTCSGAPASATCTIAPGTLTPDGTNPATATLTLQTTTVAALEKPFSPDANSSKAGSQAPANTHSSPIYSLALFLPFSFLGGVTVFRLRRRRPHSIRLLSLLALVGLLTLAGCGHSSPAAATSKAYTITVTATSGALSHSTTESVTIQ